MNMPSNQTANYALSQWSRTDQVKMDDFNADNAKLDAALKAQADILVGKAEAAALTALSQTVAGHTAAIAKLGNCQLYATSFTGDGSTSGKTLYFPHRPMLVMVVSVSGICFITVQGASRVIFLMGSSGSANLTWSGNAVTWTTNSYNYFNSSGETYRVLALLDMAQ